MPEQNKPAAKPTTVPRIMPGRFDTQYDPNRDPFYGEEYNPYKKRVDDSR